MTTTLDSLPYHFPLQMRQSLCLCVLLLFLAVVILYFFRLADSVRSLRNHDQLQLVEAQLDQAGSCDPNFEVVSSIRNGIVSVQRPDLDCVARCVDRRDYTPPGIIKVWLDIRVNVFGCELVEVYCRGREKEYRMLHTQFLNVRELSKYDSSYLKEEFFSESPASNPPDIVAFIFEDTTYLGRFLPMTTSFLAGKLEKSPGKVEEVTKIRETFHILAGGPEEREGKDRCREINVTGIFEEAGGKGYVTMFTDDSEDGLLRSSNCSQSTYQTADHTFEDFYRYSWHDASSREIFHGKGCQPVYKKTLEFVYNVWTAYPDHPKIIVNFVSRGKRTQLPFVDWDLRRLLEAISTVRNTIILVGQVGGEKRKLDSYWTGDGK